MRRKVYYSIDVRGIEVMNSRTVPEMAEERTDWSHFMRVRAPQVISAFLKAKMEVPEEMRLTLRLYDGGGALAAVDVVYKIADALYFS